MIKVTSDIRVYSLDGDSEDSVSMQIKSHWCGTNLVDIHIKDINGLGIDCYVVASDLIAAIENATNNGSR